MLGWLDKRVKKIVDKKLEETDDHISIINKDLKNCYNEINRLSAIMVELGRKPVPFDIEAYVDEYAEKLGVRRMIRSEAEELVVRVGIKTRIGKDVFVADIEDTVAFEVRPNCVYCLLGIKFLKGNAYGHYRFYEGFLANPIKDFTRSRSTKYQSLVFDIYSRPFREDEAFSIGRVRGKGKMTFALVGWSARPSIGSLSALKLLAS